MQKTQVITMPTSLGNAEAHRENPSEPWKIGYPWTDARFYGSEEQTRRLMKRTIAGYEKAEKAGAENP